MINDLIAKRKSIKQFDNVSVTNEEIISLFEAARRAPSAFNEQPWRFIIAHQQNDQEFNAVLETLSDKNKEWAQASSLLVVVLSKKYLSKTGRSNRHYMYDTASAVANLTFQALTFNLSVHQMGGFDKEKVINGFLVPEEFEPVVILAIGKKLKTDGTKSLIATELNRLPVSEILFEGKFGEVSNILNSKVNFFN